MRAILLLAIFFATATITFSADLTGEIGGRKVILHDNQTWEFAEAAPSVPAERLVLAKLASQTEVLRGKSLRYTVSYDPSVWNKIQGSNRSAEFQFQNTASSGWGMVIYEGLNYGLESLKAFVLRNAQSIDPTSGYDDVQECVVNGIPGELCSYHAVSSGLSFEFLSFLSATDGGTVQYTFWTLKSEFEKQKPEFLKMISGLELSPQ